MRLRLPVLLFVVGWITCSGFCQEVSFDKLRQDPDGMPGEQSCEQTIQISSRVELKAKVEVTVRRNGWLKIGNLKIKVIDGHADPVVYQGEALHVEFTDVTGDGFKDLVVTGVVVNTGEKEGDPKTYEAVTAVYVFDSRRREFRETFHFGPKLN
jgi:hypothetical protein